MRFCTGFLNRAVFDQFELTSNLFWFFCSSPHFLYKETLSMDSTSKVEYILFDKWTTIQTKHTLPHNNMDQIRLTTK